MPRITIVLTDDDGRRYEGEVTLTADGTAKRTRPAKAAKAATTASASSAVALDFDSHPRAFIKKHGAGMSGPRQFTLLLAHLVGGKPKVDHDLSAVVGAWAKGVMGGDYAAIYVTRAKDQGWVNSTKRGTVHLTKSWRGIFSE